MTNPNQSRTEPNDEDGVDPIDRDAAEIDARSEDAPEKIQELIEHAESIGRDVSQDVDPNENDEPEVIPG
jgi:hypothetical protein